VVLLKIKYQEEIMKYKKPKLIAKNRPSGKFAAGCPTSTRATCSGCEVAY